MINQTKVTDQKRILEQTKVDENVTVDQKNIGEYEIIKVIGKGSFGKVYLTKSNIVIKELDRNKNVDYIQREYDILQKIGDHPNIIKSIGLLKYNNINYLLLPYIEGVTIYGYIKSLYSINNTYYNYHELLEVNFIHSFLSQMLPTIKFLHTLRIAHRDIKPENIIYNEVNNHFTLIDFGLSTFDSDDDMIKKKVGSALYASKKILETYLLDLNFNIWTSNDIFSLGVIAYLILNYDFPFGRDFYDKNYYDYDVPTYWRWSKDNRYKTIVDMLLAEKDLESIIDKLSLTNYH